MRSIDINPTSLIMTIKKNSSGFQTKFGGFLTLILIILSILSFFAFGRNLIFKLNPIVYTSQSWIQTPILEKSKPIIFFNIMDINAQIYMDLKRMMNYTIVQIDADGNREAAPVIYTYMETVPCKNVSFYRDNKILNFSKVFIGDDESYQCLNNNDTNLLDLQGSFGNPRSVSWAINGKMCENSTENGNFCYPKEVIEKNFESFWSQIGIFQYYIDSSNYENPVQSNFFSSVIRSSLYNSRNDYYFFTLIDYNSDNGFILESIKNYNAFTISRHESESIYTTNPQWTIRIVLTLENLTIKYQRIYEKIQKLAADIGGFIKFFGLLFSFINMKYGKINILNYILDLYKPHNNTKRISHIDQNNYQKESNSKINVKKNNFININIKDINEYESKNEKDISNATKSKFDKKINQSFYLIDMNYKNMFNDLKIIDIIKFYLNCACCYNKKVKILIKVKDYLNDIFSIENVIRIIENFQSSNENKYEEIRKKCLEKILNIKENK